MKKYHYFVSLIYCEGTKMRFSNAETITDHEITTLGDIAMVGESLKESGDMKHNPTIMNYQLLRVEEENV